MCAHVLLVDCVRIMMQPGTLVSIFRQYIETIEIPQFSAVLTWLEGENDGLYKHTYYYYSCHKLVPLEKIV